MASKTVSDLFSLDNNIDIEFVKRHFPKQKWSDKFIRNIWHLRLTLLSEKQSTIMRDLLAQCKEADPNKLYHKVSTGPFSWQYKIMSKEAKELHEKMIDKLIETSDKIGKKI